MTGHQLLAALQALPAEDLELHVILFSSEQGSDELDEVSTYDGYLRRNHDVEDSFAPGAYQKLRVLTLSV